MLPLDKTVKTDRGGWPARRRQGLSARELARRGRGELRGLAAGGHAGRRVAGHAGDPRPGREARHRRARTSWRGPCYRRRPTARGSPPRWRRRTSADVVLVAVGEDAFQSGEGRSQADIGLKGLQEELVAAVLAVNKHVVVVLMSGRPLTFGPGTSGAPALLETWLAGSQSGHAIADVLFGDYNPCGQAARGVPAARRPAADQLRPQEHRPPGARSRRDVVGYTRHAQRRPLPVRLRPQLHDVLLRDSDGQRAARPARRRVTVKATVTNTGTRRGVEIVQLYVRDLVGSLHAAGEGTQGRSSASTWPPAGRGRSRSPEGPPTSRSTRRRQVGDRARRVQGVRRRQLARRQGGRLQRAGETR